MESSENTKSYRYRIFDKSYSNHCCFEYTVVDTLKFDINDSYHEGAICECFNRDEAILVCHALNVLNDKTWSEDLDVQVATGAISLMDAYNTLYNKYFMEEPEKEI